MIVDSCLPSQQCPTAAKKANQILGQIDRAFSRYTKYVMLTIFKVFVRPRLEYAVTAWTPWMKKDIEVLEKIQHRATRCISDVQGSYPERLQQLDLPTLEERRTRGDAIEVFKYLRGFVDVDKNSLLEMDETREPKTRHQRTFKPLKIPRSKLDLRQNFFTVRGAKLRNALPSSARESSSVNNFKNAYDNHLSQS